MHPRRVAGEGDVDINVNFGHPRYDVDVDVNFDRNDDHEREPLMSVAFVFPGQGSHRAGMASAWEGHPAHATFAEVGAAAGMPELPRLADDPEACRATAVGQPAMYAAGLAAWRALTDAGLKPHAVAGHSLGEITAAVAAGTLSVDDGARLVAERGRAFAAACRANPGGMAAVLGLGDEIQAVLADHPRVELANDNGPTQKVLAGPSTVLPEALVSAKELGGRVRELDVEGAFHTAAMAPAVVTVDTILRRIELRDPDVPLISGDWVTVSTTAGEIRRGLVDGVLSRVRWREVQRRLAEMGVTALIEAGPGGVLTGLARRTVPEVVGLNAHDPDSVQDVVDTVLEATR